VCQRTLTVVILKPSTVVEDNKQGTGHTPPTKGMVLSADGGKGKGPVSPDVDSPTGRKIRQYRTKESGGVFRNSNSVFGGKVFWGGSVWGWRTHKGASCTFGGKRSRRKRRTP